MNGNRRHVGTRTPGPTASGHLTGRRSGGTSAATWDPAAPARFSGRHPGLSRLVSEVMGGFQPVDFVRTSESSKVKVSVPGAVGKMHPPSGTYTHLISEMTVRFERLHLLTDFSTSLASDDLVYLCSITRYGDSAEIKNEIGKKMSELNAPELFRKIWSTHFNDDFLSENHRVQNDSMLNILSLLWHMMKNCLTLCKHAFNVRLYEDILTYLSSNQLQSFSPNLRLRKMVLGLIRILYNMVQTIIKSRAPLRANNAVEILQTYRSSTDEMIRAQALILQAYIITEEENEKLNSDGRTFVFLAKVLHTTLASSDHHSKVYGVTSLQVALALNRLAANDSNKKRIVQAGALPCYVRLMGPDCSAVEQTSAVQGLWLLSFTCEDDIIKEPGCIQAQQSLIATSGDQTVRQCARGVLWILQKKHKLIPASVRNTRSGGNTAVAVVADKVDDARTDSQLSEDEQSIRPHIVPYALSSERGVTQVREDHQPHRAGEVEHIFISYQWNYKKTVLKLRDCLQAAGYVVWVDVDNMVGSVLEAMADAVERAVVVLVCLAQSYKESPNCRTEAEYAFRLKKAIVPLRLESRYVPDGWLGALVGSRLVHDFSEGWTEHDLSDLYRDLGERGRITTTTIATRDGVEISKTHLPEQSQVFKAARSSVHNWTTSDVSDWLTSTSLQHQQEWFRDIDGPMLLELVSMRKDAASFFFTLLRESNFSIKDILQLSSALKHL